MIKTSDFLSIFWYQLTKHSQVPWFYNNTLLPTTQRGEEKKNSKSIFTLGKVRDQKFVSNLGNGKRYLEYIFSTVHESVCTELNDLTKSITRDQRYLTLKSLTRGIMKTTMSRKVYRVLLKLATFTGEEVETFLQVSPFVLAGKVDRHDLKVLQFFLYVLVRVSAPTIKKDDLDRLFIEIERSRYLMKTVLCDGM